MPTPTQPTLFPEAFDGPIEKISGLTYIPDFITKDQEVKLLARIDKHPWLDDLKRRVQHYGWKYDYTARNITDDLKLGALPDWLMEYCNILYQKQLFSDVPDQVIINEYQAGQGIASHIDCVPCFGANIASLSLASSCLIEFTHSKTNEKIPVLLEPRSLFVLNGDARYVWKHGIAQRKKDKMAGITIARSRRVSMTFRNVIF